jgi:hypothetical protein
MRFAAMCLGALAMVGCGADAVRETVDPVAEAADNMAASGGARVDGDMTIRMPGVEIPMTLDGVVSFEDGRARFVMDFDEAGFLAGVTAKEIEDARRDAQLPLQTIMTTEETYLSTPRVVEEGREDGVRWMKFDYSEVDEEGDLDISGINQMSEVNPDAMLRFLRTVADARETGRRTIDGEPTTRYTATVDIRRYPETVEEDRREAAQRTVDFLIEAWGSPTHRVHVWIDEDGLIRREEMTYSFMESGQTAKTRVVLDFMEVGTPQEIELPDDDEVRDISDELAEQLGG